MFSVEKCQVPSHTFLQAYVANGGYADCYSTEMPGQVSFPDFIFAFYTTPLFKLERFILTWTVTKPSTDEQARQVADGTREQFAAWHVENRNDHEILMCDYQRLTRSWLMIVPIAVARTRLYFGSAVVPSRNSRNGKPSLGLIVQMLLGFHQVYSVLLLSFTRRRLMTHPSDRRHTEMERL